MELWEDRSGLAGWAFLIAFSAGTSSLSLLKRPRIFFELAALSFQSSKNLGILGLLFICQNHFSLSHPRYLLRSTAPMFLSPGGDSAAGLIGDTAFHATNNLTYIQTSSGHYSTTKLRYFPVIKLIN